MQEGHLHRGQLVHAQVKLHHPNRTGLALRDGRFVRESAPFHLTSLEVHYAGRRVSWFSLTSALADDPFFTFTLLPRDEGTLRVVLANSRDERFEATHDLRFS